MKRSSFLVVLLLGIICFIPAVALAQDATPVADSATTTGGPVVSAVIQDEDSSFLLKVKGDIVVNADDTIQNAVVISGNATIAGTVEETLVVVNGDATINGRVDGTVTVIRGTLNLEDGSSVDDVMLVSSTLNRADGATVTGSLEHRNNDYSFGRGSAIFSFLWWIGLTVVALVAAAIFAWFGRTQLFGSVDLLRRDFVKSLISAIVLWAVLPLGATLILFTVIGIPIGLLILLVVLPLLWLTGTIVIGTWIGTYAIKPTDTGRAIGSAVVGTFVLALISLIPFVAIIVSIAGMLGAGAFVYRAIIGRNTPTALSPMVQPV